ncbi:MAG TPA: carbohydrate ABC transporter permease [Candidatus Limnocylindria bacterium]|nr:carbohydrate ABC transporter permease [Candidatus Limnocylindria bacterium]
MATETGAERALTPGVGRTAAVTRRERFEPRKFLMNAGFIALLIFFTVLFIYPFIWLVSASLKPGAEVFSRELIPDPIQWNNYSRLFELSKMGQWTINSVIVTFLAATTVTITSALVAFAFAYFRFLFRNAVFGIVLASMMLPGAVTMIPNFLIWNALGWVNTLTPLWAANLFASPFYIFLLRQFFLGLPRELFDAARVDGANYLRMWWSVALPLTRAALIVVFVFELKAAWTDLVKPLIFLRDIDLFTLPLGLKSIIDNPSIGGERHFELLAVGGVIVTVPMIVIFFLGQRYFLEGIATTGSTGR